MKKIVSSVILALCLIVAVGTLGACGKKEDEVKYKEIVIMNEPPTVFTVGEKFDKTKIRLGGILKSDDSANPTAIRLEDDEWDYDKKNNLRLSDRNIRFFLLKDRTIGVTLNITVNPVPVEIEEMSFFGFNNNLLNLQMTGHEEETVNLTFSPEESTDQEELTWSLLKDGQLNNGADEYVTLTVTDDGKGVTVKALKPTADADIELSAFNTVWQVMTTPLKIVIKDASVVSIAQDSVPISTKADFIAAFTGNTNPEDDSHLSKKYHLTADIDLENDVVFDKTYVDQNKGDIESGSDDKFSGVFDGRGYKVSNFKVIAQYDGFSLFGNVTGGTICNIGFENYTFDGYSASDPFILDIDPGEGYNSEVTTGGYGNSEVGAVYTDDDDEKLKDSGYELLSGFWDCSMLVGYAMDSTIQNVYLQGKLFGSKRLGYSTTVETIQEWDCDPSSVGLVSSVEGNSIVQGCIVNITTPDIATGVMNDAGEEITFNPTRYAAAIGKLLVGNDMFIQSNFAIMDNFGFENAYWLGWTEETRGIVSWDLLTDTYYSRVYLNNVTEYEAFGQLNSLYWDVGEGIPTLKHLDQ